MKKIIHTSQAPAAVGAYSQAVVFGNTLYVSGQIAIVPETGELNTRTIEEETHQVMNNLKAILEAAGATFDNVLKCSVFATDMNNFVRINTVYATYFNPENAPAREFVEVSNLPKFVNVEISLIAGL
ncbi:MAG: Rid family detoxifying hydrolase [Saprospiraceae bacterium]